MRYGDYVRRRWSIVLLVTVIAACASSSALGEVHIVKDGQPRAEIVIAEQPPRMVKLAAGELQSFVEKISGAKLPIVTAPTKACPVHVYVGKSAHTDRLGVTDAGLKDDGFRIVSGKDYLVLLGRDSDYTPKEPWARSRADRARAQQEWDKLTGERWGHPKGSEFKAYNAPLGVWQHDERGSLNAVYEFLRTLGVRWYMPGDFGQVLPQTKTIVVPESNRTVIPDFGYRAMLFYSNAFFQASADEALWQLRLGLRATGSPGGHGIDDAIHHDKTRAAHPEYFTMVGGKRDTVTRGGKPCLSSEGLLATNIEFAQALFRIYGNPIVSVMPTDAYADLCQCDLCRGKDTRGRGWEGQLSDYVWGYVDRVAQALHKTNPDKKVSCYAYGSYLLPPEKIEKLSPNVVVGICQWRTDFLNPEIRDKYRNLRQAWLKKTSGKLYIWDYYLHGRPGKAYEGMPVYFPRLISEDMRSLKGIVAGEGIEVYRTPGAVSPDPALAVNHLNCYVTARLWWDATQDMDAMLEEYYTLFYGPAAKEMKSFVEHCEAEWPRMAKEAGAIDKALELLSAGQKAAGDSIYGKRVALIGEFMRPLSLLRDKLAVGRKDAPRARVGIRRAKDIELDGKLDEPFWQGLPVYPLRELLSGGKPDHPTSFKVVWADDKSLYIGITCHDLDMKGLTIGSTRADDSSIWNGDCVEILLETQKHTYYQLAISPSGAIVDVDRKGGVNTRWNSGARAVGFVGDGFWSLEVRVPVAGEQQDEVDPDNGLAGRQPSSTHPWYFNICRQRVRRQEREFSAFSPTGKPSFHDTMKFGGLSTR